MLFSLLSLFMGVLFEAMNVLVFRRQGKSGIGLIPPIAISAGVGTLPGVPVALRWAISLEAFAVHFWLTALERRKFKNS